MKSIFEELCDIQKRNKECILVTVVDKTGEGPQVIGSKMVVSKDGTIKGTIGGGNFEKNARKKAIDLFKTKKNIMLKYDLSSNHIHEDAQDVGMICGGTLTLFYEYINVDTPVYIFGAGHVGRAIVNHLKYLDYNITIIDHREGIFDNFEEGINTIVGEYEQVISNLNILDTYIIVTTSGHSYDYEVLRSIYKKECNPSYIGLMSSKIKLKEVIEKIRDDFGSELDLNNLYSPVGLDIGGSTPNEIAISIIAEMQSIKYNKNGHKNMREVWYI